MIDCQSQELSQITVELWSSQEFLIALLQAMVEFERIEDARTAKMHLNGADIYSGCCTMKVEFARPTRLTVTKNDDESWDFEAPQLPPTAPPTGNSLLGSPGRASMGGGMGMRPDDYRSRSSGYDVPPGELEQASFVSFL